MSSVLDLIASINEGAVEAGGVKWRIKAIRSDAVRDLRYHLLHVRIPTEEDIVEEQAIATRPEAEQAAARASIAARRAREAMTPERLADAATKDEALVCAGVVAVWQDGAWSPVTITPAGTAANPAASPPSMPADALPASVVAAISVAVWHLSTDGGEAAARIRSFLGAS